MYESIYIYHCKCMYVYVCMYVGWVGCGVRVLVWHRNEKRAIARRSAGQIPIRGAAEGALHTLNMHQVHACMYVCSMLM